MPLAILFDMDGVLFHTAPLHAEAYAQVLAEAGLSMPDYAETLTGRRTEEVMRGLLLAADRPASEQAVRALVRAKQERALAALIAAPPLAPQVGFVLERLALRRRLGLVSSASRDSVAVFLASSGCGGLFEVVLTGDDVSRGKPSPDPYQLALLRLGVEAGAAVVVEDAPSGILAARAAGIPVIGITSGGLDRERLLACGAVRVIDSLTELVDLYG
ncbi:MAG: HAD family phosphatase [Magnetococcales bacterium]|nr:HAD family phosphatase [Magnetococcales bacterium]